MVVASMDGTVVFMRTDEDSLCVCCPCDRKHIYCRYVECDGGQRLMDFVEKVCTPFTNEGKRVRLTVEVLP